MSQGGETNQYEFKAEIKQLLDILVHSLYTNREIFIRELVSNASDALDKLRFETARGTEIADSDLPLEIRIDFDQEKKILKITDTGIGLTREEVVENIGTIAKSGSADFLKMAGEQKEGLDNIIGRFGVGFYSVFMAASEVNIRTRSFRPEAAAVAWKSDGLGTYEISDLDQPQKRGTEIEIFLKDDAAQFADQNILEQVIKRHSNFVSFPIFVKDEQVNTIPALWREPKSSVTKEQYAEFYKFLSLDQEAPLRSIHISVDAPVQFNSLLFLPQKNNDLFNINREQPGLDLFVHRVLIQKGNKDLIPEYLGFVRGVVDSEDLPLNIARESIQENAAILKISSNLTKQVLKELKKMATESQEEYSGFWKEFGRIFKMGYSDYANLETFGELLRFNSSQVSDADGLVSLDDYIQRAKPDQKEIYYIFGPTRDAVNLSPHLEIFKTKGVEVLYLYEPLDEFALESLRTFKGFDLKSAEFADMESLEKFESIESQEKADPLSEDEEGEFPKFLGRVKDILGDRVTSVKVSTRLSESPCCLVNPDGGLSSSMQKILHIVNKDSSIPQKVMEINRDHPLIRNLFTIYQKNPQDDYLTSAIEQIYESSLLMEGYLKDPHAMVRRIQDVLGKASTWYLASKGK